MKQVYTMMHRQKNIKILRMTVKRDFTDLSRCRNTHLVVIVHNNVKFLFLLNITFQKRKYFHVSFVTYRNEQL